jgi:hypothetical protein
MCIKIGTNICKCSVWSLNPEPWTRSVRKDELHVAVEFGSLLLNFTVMDMGLREKQTLQKNQIYTRNVSCSRFMLFLNRRSEHFCIGFHFRRVRKIAKKKTISFVMSACPHRTTWPPQSEFSWNLIFVYFSKICRKNSIFNRIWQE